MTDPRFPVECYACGEPIESESELVTTQAGWDVVFNVSCHPECLLDGVAVS